MDNINKIYNIHQELSKTERLIAGTQQSLDEIAKNPHSISAQNKYVTLNCILNVCLAVRGDLQKQLNDIHLEIKQASFN